MKRLQSEFPLPELHSILPHGAWPAIPTPEASLLLALQYQLGESAWWPAERLRAMQIMQLGAILKHAWDSVPFYRARLGDAGYDPVRAMETDGIADIFARLPALARAEIQAAGTALHAMSMPPGHGKITRGETSGSTGQPIVFLSSELEKLHWNAYTLRDHLWHGRDMSAKLGAIRFARQDGPLAGWGPATDAIFKTGPSAVLRIDTPITQQVEWLLQEQPTYLISYPSNLEALAQAFIARGLRLEGLREVRAVSEVVRPELRAMVQAAWGVKLIDIYSTKEAGYLALQCPEYEHYHVQGENVLVEIVDQAGAACAPGQTGRMLVTALHKFAMPLIRYEIGDYAVAGAPCACGRGLPVITQILGRRRNMMRLPNGDRRWPLCDLTKLPEVPGIRQYQYVQDTVNTIEVRLVVAPVFARTQETRITEFIHKKLGHPFDIRYTYHDTIERSAGGKFEDFVCAVPD